MKQQLTWWLGCLWFLFHMSLQAQRTDIRADWQVINTKHHHIIFPKNLNSLGNLTAIIAEETYQWISSETGFTPEDMIYIKILDNMDEVNGGATIFPRNMIYLMATPPNDSSDVINYQHWIELVVLHEMVHVFVMDVTGGVYRWFRQVFGKLYSEIDPFLLFLAPPNHFLPLWFHEGLTVYMESKFTERGRLRSEDYEMYFRTAVMELNLPDMGHLHEYAMKYPQGNSSYIWGSRFVAFLMNRFGHEAIWNKVRRNGSRFPFFYNFFNSDVFGDDDYGSLFEKMKNELIDEQEKKISDLKSQKSLTQSETVLSFKFPLRVDYSFIADNELAFFHQDIDQVPALTIVDLISSKVNHPLEPVRIADYQLSYDGKRYLYYTEIDVTDVYSLKNSVKRYDIQEKKTETLLYQGRFRDVDVSSDGKFLVIVQLINYQSSLVMYDIEKKTISRLIEPSDHLLVISHPRFSADGKSLVYSGREEGNYKNILYEMNLDTRGITTLLNEPYSCLQPSYTPDEEWIVFSSSHTGVANLYAYDRSLKIVKQITHVASGAFFPHVDRKQQWIYFLKYTSSGYELVRISYDPSTWFNPDNLMVKNSFTQKYPVSKPASFNISNFPISEYQPTSYLYPLYWFPRIESSHVGLSFAGQDPLEIHTYTASLLPARINSMVLDMNHGFYPIADVYYRYLGWSPVWELRYLTSPVVYQNYYPDSSFNYWTYQQSFDSLWTWTLLRNHWSLDLLSSLGGFSVLAHPWNHPEDSFEQLILKNAMRGSGGKGAISFRWDTSFNYQTHLGVTPYAGTSALASIGYVGFFPKNTPNYERSNYADYQMFKVSVSQFIPFVKPYASGELWLSYGELWNEKLSEWDRDIFGQYLYVGGESIDGFNVRGNNLDNIKKGTKALVVSTRYHQLLWPIFKNWGTSYFFNKTLSAETFWDGGVASMNSYKPLWTNGWLSVLGLELTYQMIWFKYATISSGVGTLYQLHDREWSSYIWLGSLKTSMGQQ